MTTLYDILGVSPRASVDQINHGFQERQSAFTALEMPTPDDSTRIQAVREAHSVLSSPTRRQQYDARLDSAKSVVLVEVERKSPPWGVILLVVCLLAGGGWYASHESKKAEIALKALEAEKAKAEADRVTREAETEEAALARERLAKRAADEATNRNLSARARVEGERVHSQLEAFDRTKAMAAERQERQDRQDKYERERSDREARQRSLEETSRMERALRIPILRH